MDDKKYLTEDSFRAILDDFYKADKASIAQSNSNTPFELKTITIPLDNEVARTSAYRIGFPFKSLYVAQATDANVTVNFVPDSNDIYQDAVPLSNKDSLTFDTAKGEAYLYWGAQPAKTITLCFFIRGQFKSGSYLTQAIGSSASSLTLRNPVTVNTSATLVASSNATRTAMTLYNSGATDCYIGNSTVTTSNGILLASGERVKITQNISAYYAIVSAGTTTIRILEES